ERFGLALPRLESLGERSLRPRWLLFSLVLGTVVAATTVPASAGGQPGPVTLSMYCSGPGPNGTVAAGQTDTCGVDLTGGTLQAGSEVVLMQPSPAATTFSCSPSGQRAPCSFPVSTTMLHGFLGTETIHFAPDGPSQGGGAPLTQGAEACTPTCHSVSLRIDGPGAVVGTPFRPRFLPAAPYAYKICSGPNQDGTVSETQVDTCRIYTTGLGGQFVQGDIVTIARVSPVEATTVTCVDATGPADTVVQYPAPTATDNAPGAVSISCSPASGSSFAVGDTTVTCTATDVSGNSATAGFRVSVQNTFDSLCRVTRLEVTNGVVAHSLCVKLEGAADAVASGDTAAATGKLGAYVNEVEAQSGKSLTDQEAQDLEGLGQLLMP